MNRPACVVCGGDNDGNHHCPPETIKRIEARRTDREPRIDNRDSYGTRLRIGFAFYSEDYNYDS